MKKIALAAAMSMAASTAFAGTMEEPIMEPEVIVEEKSSKALTEEPNTAYLTPRTVEQLPGALTPDVFRTRCS